MPISEHRKSPLKKKVGKHYNARFSTNGNIFRKLVHCTNKSRAKIPNEVNVIGINFQKCTPPQIIFFFISFL